MTTVSIPPFSLLFITLITHVTQPLHPLFTYIPAFPLSSSSITPSMASKSSTDTLSSVNAVSLSLPCVQSGFRVGTGTEGWLADSELPSILQTIYSFFQITLPWLCSSSFLLPLPFPLFQKDGPILFVTCITPFIEIQVKVQSCYNI